MFAEDGSPLMARGPAGQISNWQLRRALEQAAWIPDAGSYDPTVGITDLVGIPVPPGAPWLVAGWGLLSSDPGFAVVPSSLAVLGVPGAPEATPRVGWPTDGHCHTHRAPPPPRQLPPPPPPPPPPPTHQRRPPR